MDVFSMELGIRLNFVKTLEFWGGWTPPISPPSICHWIEMCLLIQIAKEINYITCKSAWYITPYSFTSVANPYLEVRFSRSAGPAWALDQDLLLTDFQGITCSEYNHCTWFFLLFMNHHIFLLVLYLKMLSVAK
jgi:hypothetical protein